MMILCLSGNLLSKNVKAALGCAKKEGSSIKFSPSDKDSAFLEFSSLVYANYLAVEVFILMTACVQDKCAKI